MANKDSKGKGKTKNTSDKAVKKDSSKSSANPLEGLGLPEKVDLIWTIAFVVAAFVLGFFIHGLLSPPQTTPTPLLNSTQAGASGSSGAPVLTPEQVQSGKLPPGHPDIGGQPSGQSTQPSTQTGSSSATSSSSAVQENKGGASSAGGQKTK
ncbi:MAG: hypothetical protein QME63_09430 [Actinomycetota bacterium]|nr:hypothetical protein [Actinomycetota bacterium]